MLVDAPREALGLASAAFFRADEAGRFVRTAAVGWRDGDTRMLDAGDRLVRYLHTMRSPARIAAINWDRTDVPHGTAAPALALPIPLRDELYGFVLYGGHTWGADLDPDEVGIIARLGPAAIAACAYVRADGVRAELESWRTRAEQLQQRLDGPPAALKVAPTADGPP